METAANTSRSNVFLDVAMSILEAEFNADNISVGESVIYPNEVEGAITLTRIRNNEVKPEQFLRALDDNGCLDNWARKAIRISPAITGGYVDSRDFVNTLEECIALKLDDTLDGKTAKATETAPKTVIAKTPKPDWVPSVNKAKAIDIIARLGEHGLSHREIAKRMSYSYSHVYNSSRLGYANSLSDDYVESLEFLLRRVEAKPSRKSSRSAAKKKA